MEPTPGIKRVLEAKGFGSLILDRVASTHPVLFIALPQQVQLRTIQNILPACGKIGPVILLEVQL